MELSLTGTGGKHSAWEAGRRKQQTKYGKLDISLKCNSGIYSETVTWVDVMERSLRVFRKKAHSNRHTHSLGKCKCMWKSARWFNSPGRKPNDIYQQFQEPSQWLKLETTVAGRATAIIILIIIITTTITTTIIARNLRRSPILWLN